MERSLYSRFRQGRQLTLPFPPESPLLERVLPAIKYTGSVWAHDREMKWLEYAWRIHENSGQSLLDINYSICLNGAVLGGMYTEFSSLYNDQNGVCQAEGACQGVRMALDQLGESPMQDKYVFNEQVIVANEAIFRSISGAYKKFCVAKDWETELCDDLITTIRSDGRLNMNLSELSLVDTNYSLEIDGEGFLEEIEIHKLGNVIKWIGDGMSLFNR